MTLKYSQAHKNNNKIILHMCLEMHCFEFIMILVWNFGASTILVLYLKVFIGFTLEKLLSCIPQ